MEKVKLNSKGINKKIKANILDDTTMKAIGFTNFYEPNWFFSRRLNLPGKHIEISFNVSIPKDGSDISIDILDDDFCQPYDYQYMLEEHPSFELAKMVKEQVEDWMEYLTQKGVLEGHIRGEYI